MTSLSVLVPVYNEEHLVATSLDRLRVLETSPLLERVQIVVVDDCSKDGTAEALRRFREEKVLRAVRPSTTAADAAYAQGEREGEPLRGVRGQGEREGEPLRGVRGQGEREGEPPRGVRGQGEREGEPPRGVRGGERSAKIEWVFLRHEKNGGKGKAIQTALARADCELTVIHDADLEYHPKDLLRMVKVFEEEGADAVFGSRFAGGESRRVLFFRHELGNRLLTFLTNLVTNLNLTDMETCYKAVRTDLLRSIPIVSNDFRLEPELTIKLAKREARIFEVPISYSGRTYQEGKKIDWRDGVKALAAITRFALGDDVYAADDHGSHILGRLARAPRFNAWMADTIRPLCGERVLEIGSGTGNLTRRLVPRRRYVASDVNPLYLHTLRALEKDRPYLATRFCDVTDVASFPRGEQFDTVICLNVVEHVDDDRAALENVRSVLAPGGRALVLVPQGEDLYGTLDAVLGHKRRYSEASLRRLAADAGFSVKEVLRFNRVGTPAWWLNGKLLKRRWFGLFQVLALNALMPLFRRVDAALPFAPLSLIAVLERDGAAAAAPKAEVAR